MSMEYMPSCSQDSARDVIPVEADEDIQVIEKQTKEAVEFARSRQRLYGIMKHRKKRKIMEPTDEAKRHKYKCPRLGCLWTFVTPAKLERHSTTHTVFGYYVCQLCKTHFSHEYNIYPHWRRTCKMVTDLYTTRELHDASTEDLRQIVFTILYQLNEGDDHYVCAGIVFVPSEEYMLDVSESTECELMSTCHICGLDLPVKFLERHIQAHQSRYLISSICYNKYMCHLCATTFRDDASLYDHWRRSCDELMAYTKKNGLSNNQLASLAFLHLQQTVPLSVISKMANHDWTDLMSNTKFDRGANDHKYPLEAYFRCVEFVYPLNEANDVTQLDSSQNISDRLSSVLDPQRVTNLSRINLLAYCCPSFYGSRRMWRNIVGTDHVFRRRLLTYYNKESIIKYYEINEETMPSLDLTKDGSISWKVEKYDYNCNKCDKNYVSLGRLERHHMAMHEVKRGFCVLCKTDHESFNRLILHWKMECRLIKMVTSPRECEGSAIRFRNYVYKLIAQNYASEGEDIIRQIKYIKHCYLEICDTSFMVEAMDVSEWVRKMNEIREYRKSKLQIDVTTINCEVCDEPIEGNYRDHMNNAHNTYDNPEDTIDEKQKKLRTKVLRRGIVPVDESAMIGQMLIRVPEKLRNEIEQVLSEPLSGGNNSGGIANIAMKIAKVPLPVKKPAVQPLKRKMESSPKIVVIPKIIRKNLKPFESSESERKCSEIPDKLKQRDSNTSNSSRDVLQSDEEIDVVGSDDENEREKTKVIKIFKQEKEAKKIMKKNIGGDLEDDEDFVPAFDD